MEKERLTIGRARVTVEYEFLNESNQDIITEVAFPVPPYYWYIDQNLPNMEDFRVWVGGQAVAYQTETKAMVGGMNYGALLRGLGVDVASFGHATDDPTWPDIERLSSAQKDTLRRVALIYPHSSQPKWRVDKTYHWRQTFPAHKRIQIRHEYTPLLGLSSTSVGKKNLRAKDPEIGWNAATSDQQASGDVKQVRFSDACVDPPLRKRLAAAKGKDEFVGFQVSWVDYILTTANTWKTPIKQFELTIEKPKSSEPNHQWYLSLCWDGQIQRKDVDHFVARAVNFVPAKELRVMFFNSRE